MWRKALSNYSVYLGSSWWNIYITVMEVLRVIKLARWVSSLFPHFSSLFVGEKTNMWTKPLFLMMELLCSQATPHRLSEWLLFYSILSVCHLCPFELECMPHCKPLTVQNKLPHTYQGSTERMTKVGYRCMQQFHVLFWCCWQMSKKHIALKPPNWRQKMKLLSMCKASSFSWQVQKLRK